MSHIRFSLVLALIVALPSVAEDTSTGSNASLQNFGGSKRAQIQDINANFSKWRNKQVTLEGQITKVGPQSQTFVLDGDGIFNDQILVVGSKALTAAGASNSASGAGSSALSPLVGENERVMVTGKVRRMTLSELRRDYGSQLGSEITTEWKATMPVLVVSDTTMVRRAEDSVGTSASSTTRSSDAPNSGSSPSGPSATDSTNSSQ
jgi:hypothetical protein